MDRGVIATASELLEGRHYPSVVALITDALEDEPECVPLLLLRARAHIALRRDLEAQADLRDLIRLDPRCGFAYRLLGELAARRDENESAAIFFREALRLDPHDREAADWLLVVESSVRPAAAANKLPAPAAAAGRFSSVRGRVERARTGGESASRTLSSPVRGEPRFARGTLAPDDERPTDPFTRNTASPAPRAAAPRSVASSQVAPPQAFARGSRPAHAIALVIRPEPAPDPALELAPAFPRAGSEPVVRELPSLARPQQPIAPRPIPRSATPEMPGFGDYLVDSGILTRERLRAAQAYQRSMKVQLSTAIVTLGLATPQRIEWAAVAHQSQLARDRR